MNFDKNRITKLGIVMVLSIALLILVILAQQQQNLRTRATPPDVYDAFAVTDNTTGKALLYKDESGVRTYETQSLDVRIKVDDLKKL